MRPELLVDIIRSDMAQVIYLYTSQKAGHLMKITLCLSLVGCDFRCRQTPSQQVQALLNSDSLSTTGTSNLLEPTIPCLTCGWMYLIQSFISKLPATNY